MASCGYLPNLIKLIQSYLSDREFKVRVVQSLSDPRRVLARVFQGSVLSPILLNIFSQDISTHPNGMIALFADDIALLSSGRCITNIATNILKLLPLIHSWYSIWRLRTNEKNFKSYLFLQKTTKSFPKTSKQLRHRVVKHGKIPSSHLRHTTDVDFTNQQRLTGYSQSLQQT